MNASNTASALQMKRLIKSSRERVFEAWTTPEQIPHWFGPATCRVLDAQIDLRVGGSYRFRVMSEKMGELVVSGEYREVKAPEKLVFTWKWEDDEDWDNLTSIVTVEFTEKEGGTEVALTHEGFPNDESAENHEHGWNGCLDKMAIRASVMAEVYGAGRFSWNELMAPNVEGAASFYTKLFGWDTESMPGGMPYTLFKQNGKEVAGLMQTKQPGSPAQWIPYVTVKSADEMAARLAELGGKVCAGPMDIPTVGRIAVAQDPQGATFGIFQRA